jgi:hypothetical protein
MASGFFVLLTWRLPGLCGVQYPPEFIETGKGLLFFHPTLLDNTYNPVRDTFTTAVYAKNVGFQIVPPPFAVPVDCKVTIPEKWEKLVMLGKSISQEKSQIGHGLT